MQRQFGDTSPSNEPKVGILKKPKFSSDSDDSGEFFSNKKLLPGSKSGVELNKENKQF